jgi:DNA-binding LacI/PurR family transcriptional regulator
VIVSIRDVAQRAGVSISTASRALNDKPDVNKEVRQRVLAAAAELNYTANVHARVLGGGRSRTLGLIIASTSAAFLNTVVTGILDTVAANGYSIIVRNTDEDPRRELLAHQQLRAERVIGLLITSVQSGSGPLRQLQTDGIPFVLVNRRVDDLDTDYVIGDLQDGVQQIVAHLVQLGHRRIAFIGGQMNRFPVRERWLGYCQGLAAHGIPYDPALAPAWDEQIDTVGGCVATLLANPQPPTAIVGYNDWIAPAILRALTESGLRIPEDISVVGYDDLPIVRYLLPPLTSMTQPGYEIGQTGARILLDRLRPGNDSAEGGAGCQHRLFKSELIVRQSTGVAPRSDVK